MLSGASLVATFIAGLLSFFSPCTVPLMPAYLSCVSGVGSAQLATAPRGSFRGRLIGGSLLYVAGFALVFVISGALIGGLGAGLAASHRGAGLIRGAEIVGGVLMVAYGLVMAGALRWTGLLREWRVEMPARLRDGGMVAAFPLGVLFGLAWTPCVGANLSFALALAAVSATAVSGSVLLFVYALGIGMPFLMVALLWASLPELPGRLARLAGPLARAGGVLTAALGLLILTGAYTHLTSWLVQFSSAR